MGLHGANVASSGLFPSNLISPVGSSRQPTPCLTSLIAACRRCLLGHPQQLHNAGKSVACRLQYPDTSPRTATLTVLSSILRPRADTGDLNEFGISSIPPKILLTLSFRASVCTSFQLMIVSLLEVKSASWI